MSQEQPNQEKGQRPEAAFAHTMLQSLVFAARLHGADLSVGRLVHEFNLPEAEPDLDQLAKMAKANGFKAARKKLAWGDLANLGQAYPVVARLANGNGLVIVAAAEREGQRQVAIVDPLADRPGVITLDFDDFRNKWSGQVLLLKRVHGLADEKQPFGLRWFIPELLKVKRIFFDVALAAIIIPLVGLAQPLFFQLVIDKVLVHQGYSTLYVLTAGIIVATLFEGAFGFLRQFLLIHATKRIDIRVAQRTFGHLLSLPLAFFEKRYAGVIVKHMQQTEKIRGFLTGRLFLTLLDSVALVVFIPILFLYSVKLTLVVLFFAGLICLVIFSLIRPFRRRLKELYLAEGDRQAFLVENIHGMNTVKALAIEPRQKKEWDQKAASAVAKSFNVGLISALAGNLTKVLSSLMTICVIALGAFDVFENLITVGALVAFNMLSGRVSGPLVAIVSLIHEYQEAALSVRMLGEVMNAPPERVASSGGLRPRLKGGLSLEGVSFKYPGSDLWALRNLDLKVAPGTVLGVVGKSGSGKTTLARLVQGLYPPTEGLIKMDGLDLREIDIAHLRRSIGVVLQENFLFRGSIRHNIQVSKSDATFAQVREAARLAGADEFIERLPQGFDTWLEEGAVNLSGGQKQRLAIARALLIRPPVLVLDEATSALDPESEAIVKANLKEISQGRTVVIISHRLTNLVEADAICVLQEGRVAGLSRHQELLETCELYARLWNQQVGGGAA